MIDPSRAASRLSPCHADQQVGREKTVAEPTESRIRCNSRGFSCNIAPLCRRHHRLKTHSTWTHTVLEPGSFLWTSPHGYQFLRDHHGTLDVSRDRRPPGRSTDPPGPQHFY